MRALRKPHAAAAGLALALWVLSWTPAAASRDAALPDLPGGRAVDALGNVVEGVEILIVDPASAARPVARAVTDAAGRFRVPGLAPDVYRIAALKEGYLTAVATFDTTARTWIDVVLQPRPDAGSPEAARLPGDATWVLRAPRRSVLREIDARPADADAESVATGDAASDSWRLRVDQMFALAADVGDPDGRTSAGTDTLVRVDSSLGERGSISVDGRHRSLDTLVADHDGAATHDAGTLSLALSYDTSLDSTLSVNAYYDHAGIETASLDPGVEAVSRRSRSWGYDASWRAQLDARSSLQVSMDYRGSAVDVPIDPVTASAVGLDGAVHALAAGGRYESLPASDHQLRIDFAAQVGTDEAWFPSLASPRGVAAASTAVRDVDGLRLGIDAQDTWYLGGPFSVLYGLGYRHAVAPVDTSLVVPRVGGVVSTRGAVVRVVVAYHDATAWGEDPYAIAYRPEEPLGFEGELEVPLADGVSVRGTASYEPIQLDALGQSASPFGRQASIPLFVTDGNAAVDRHSVALVKDTGETRTFVELETGEARGTLAAFVPFDVTPRAVADRSLRFRTGRLGVRVVSTGTDLLLEYRRIAEGVPSETAATSVEQRALELRLVQDLLSRPGIGHWRLLVALRAASLESTVTEIAAAESRPAVDPAGHRVSAGLSVLF